MLDRLPPIFKNFYFLLGGLFFIYMLFISDRNIINQTQLSNKLGKLEEQKRYYINKIQEVEVDRAELMSNQQLLEKFAREKYLMKKNTEDVYVIVEE